MNHSLNIFAHGMGFAGEALAKAGKASALDILQKAVDMSADSETLSAYARGALCLYDLEALHDALSRIEGNNVLNADQRSLVNDIRSGPLQAVELTEQLEHKHPLSFSPVEGRVLYVLHKSLPYARDGYSTRSHNLAKALLDIGVDLVCLTRPGFPFDLHANGDPGEPVLPAETIDGVIYHHLHDPMRSDYPPRPIDHMAHASVAYLKKASNMIAQEIRRHRPACVVAASNHVTALPACLAAHMTGLPFIYEVRGFWEITHASRDPAYPLTITGRQERFLEIATVRAADAVLTLTEPMQAELVARGISPEKIGLVPNASDPNRFTPVPRNDRLARLLNLQSDVPVIGYVGSFTQYEGLDYLVSACAALRKRGRTFRLLLVGGEPPTSSGARPVTDMIKRIAADANLNEWLIMPGRVPYSDVDAWYSLIDIAPFPRKSQPVTELVSPLKPFEALAMEKAVVVSSVAGMDGIVKHEKTGLVFSKDDVESLTVALDRLLSDKILRDRLGEAGRKWITSSRNWRKTAQNMMSGIEPVMSIKLG